MDRYRDWLEQASRDPSKARLDLENEYYEWACFTAQQAAEKAADALAMKLHLEVWGHAVSAIIRELREKIDVPGEMISHAQRLDALYILTRYPSGFDRGKPADHYKCTSAEEALNAASAIIGFCQDHIARL
jgi:HEPN domain-containing protein